MSTLPTPHRSSLRHSGRIARGLLSLLALALPGLVTVGATRPADASPGTPAAPVQSTTAEEEHLLQAINQARRTNGLAPLVNNPQLGATSRRWAESMRTAGHLRHDPNLGAQVQPLAPAWVRYGENVGVGYDIVTLHQMFWASASHRANIVGPYNQVGVGVARGSDGRLWVTVRFLQAPVPAGSSTTGRHPDRVGVRREDAYYLRSSLSTGPATTTFWHGRPDDIAVTGDWDGDGISTPGVFRDGRWELRNSNSSGPPDIVVRFGRAGDIPLVGDWDGDGIETVGLWRNGTFMIRNRNISGEAERSVHYGRPTDQPLVGDWDGDGIASPGVRRGNAYYLRNSFTGGNANLTYAYGTVGDTPVTGDWDGDGIDTPGVRRGNAYYLRNSHAGGNADHTFGYGWATDQVVVGAWD